MSESKSIDVTAIIQIIENSQDGLDENDYLKFLHVLIKNLTSNAADLKADLESDLNADADKGATVPMEDDKEEPATPTFS